MDIVQQTEFVVVNKDGLGNFAKEVNLKTICLNCNIIHLIYFLFRNTQAKTR